MNRIKENMKIKMPQMDKIGKYVLIALLILIPLYLLTLCMNKRVEKFENLIQEQEEQENFINLSSLGIDLGDSNGKKLNSFNTPNTPNKIATPLTSDVKTSFNDSSEFKGSDNKDLIKQIMPVDQIKNKNLDKVPDLKNKVLNSAIEEKIKSQSNSSDGIRGGVKQVGAPLLSDNTKQLMQKYIQNDTFKNQTSSQSSSNNILGTCNFFNDECPSDHTDMGSIGINGLPSGMTLLCGNVSSTTPASFTAEISNGSIKDIIIKNAGAGYLPNKKYNITVSGKGSGAILEPIVGDDGTIKVVNVKNGGSGYTDTPQIMIENSSNSGKCHFCCKK